MLVPRKVSINNLDPFAGVNVRPYPNTILEGV